jgi:hypothetical protein
MLLRQREIESRAIEALERARMLPPGAKRRELLKEAGRLRFKAMTDRLADEAAGRTGRSS